MDFDEPARGSAIGSSTVALRSAALWPRSAS